MARNRLELPGELEKRIVWLAWWTIHHANRVHPKDQVKVGGHTIVAAASNLAPGRPIHHLEAI